MLPLVTRLRNSIDILSNRVNDLQEENEELRLKVRKYEDLAVRLRKALGDI